MYNLTIFKRTRVDGNYCHCCSKYGCTIRAELRPFMVESVITKSNERDDLIKGNFIDLAVSNNISYSFLQF